MFIERELIFEGMYQFIVVLFFLFSIYGNIYAQNADEKERLLAELEKIPDDSLRIKKTLDLAYGFYLNNTELARFFINTALNESISADYEKGIADAYNLLGIISKSEGDFEASQRLFKMALDIYLKIKHHRGIVNCYNNLGMTFANQSNYSKALDYYYKGMQYLEEHPEVKLRSLIYSNLANLYHDVNLLDESSVYLKKAESAAIGNSDKPHLIYIYNLHGVLLREMGEKDSALVFFKKSLKIAKELNNKSMMSAVFRNIGDYYLKTDSTTANKYFRESLNSLDSIENNIETIRTLNQITYLHYFHGNIDTAVKYAKQSMVYSKKINFNEGIKNSALYLSYIYSEQSQYKEAFHYRLIHDSINNNFYRNNSIQSISNLFQTLEYQRHEYELELAIKERRINSLVLLVVAFALFVLFMFQRKLTKRAKVKHESLSGELTTNAMMLAKQNEVFSKIELILKQNKQRFTPENQVTVQNIINEIKLNQNEETWNSFDLYFNKVHKKFHKKLNEDFPNLSVNEQRLCALLRLNMTTKEISSVTLQTAHSINIARGRLRKKLGLANQKTSIYNFLSKY